MTARKAPARAPRKAPASAGNTAKKPAKKATPAKKAPSSRAPARKPAKKAGPVTPQEEPAEVEAIDRRTELLELRTELRARLRSPETPASAVAAISRELRAVGAELDALTPEEVSRVDELASRRAARRAGSADSAPASRRSQPRRRGRSDRTS